MKESIEEVKTEFRAKLASWNNIKSKKIKISLMLLAVALVALKVFTTVLTFDWISGLFSS